MTSTPGEARPPDAAEATSGTGAIAWGLGLLAIVCFPFVSSVVAGMVMFVVGRAQRTKGVLARENGLRAANWGLTYALSTVVLVGVPLFLGAVVLEPGAADEYGLDLPVTVFWVVTLWHVVLCVWGAVVAHRGRVFWGNGIHFLHGAG